MPPKFISYISASEIILEKFEVYYNCKPIIVYFIAGFPKRFSSPI